MGYVFERITETRQQRRYSNKDFAASPFSLDISIPASRLQISIIESLPSNYFVSQYPSRQPNAACRAQLALNAFPVLSERALGPLLLWAKGFTDVFAVDTCC